MQVYLTKHARERLKKRLGMEFTPAERYALCLALTEDSHHWPDARQVELELCVNGQTLYTTLRRSQFSDSKWAIVTITTTRMGSINHAKRRKKHFK